MLKELQCQEMLHRLESRRGARSARLTSLEALLQGRDVDPQTIEPLSRQYERAILLKSPELTASLNGEVSDSRKIFEAVVGRDDSLPREFFEGGSRAANAVCLVIGLDIDSNPSLGTGLCIAPGLMLTNNHVLPTFDIASQAEVEFGFWTATSGAPHNPVRVQLDPDAFFFTDVLLDFTIVAIDPMVASEIFDRYGAIDLLPISGKALVGEAVNIIHHGGGRPQSVVIRNNTVVDVFDDWIHYTTDTMPGASGAPVMNDQWQIVALHHASVERTTADGRMVVINEGIRISSIWSRIEKEIT